ncbi:lytic transglycosylase domain-containing protein, partial [Escherichia coli]|nr:lytic transglycosylase domain-containing protein [Escherichia coli]
MQVMPGTFETLKRQFPGKFTNINDPQQNIEAGIIYLAQQLTAFGGNLPLALAAYNAGPGAVQKYGGVPPYKETRNYVNNILR